MSSNEMPLAKVSRTKLHLHRTIMQQPTNQLLPTARTKCFSFEATSADRRADGTFEFRLPHPARNTAELSLASFECTTTEPAVTSEENAVAWTEGLRLTTGPSPSDDHGFNIFSHELVIRETVSAGVYKYIKLGVCPALNEISSFVSHSGGWRSNHASQPISTAEIFSTTNAKNQNAAPHYVGPFQAWQTANASDPRISAMRLRGVCMATVDKPVDFGDSAVIVPADTDFTAPVNSRPGFYFANGTWQDRLATTQNSSNVYVDAVFGGFIACSPWFPNEIASFLNHQTTTVTDIKTDSSHESNGSRPANLYSFSFTNGRFQVVRTSGSRAFALLSNTTTDSAYKYGNMQWHVSPDESPESTNTTLPSAAPNGYVGILPTLASAMGFGGGSVVAARTNSAGEYGVWAGRDFAARFETTVAPAFYTPATLATSVAQSMNGSALVSSAADATGYNQYSVAQFLFTDSTGVAHAVSLGSGRRTPFQLAESLAFQLSRLDRRGVYFSTSGAQVNVATLDASVAQSAGASDRLIAYTVLYDATTKKFTISNQEVDSYAFANTSSQQLSPLINNGAFDSAPVRHTFEISFRKSDAPGTLATLLGVTAINTTLAASVLGFVGERVYRGSSIVSETATSAAFYDTTFTRGLANDATVSVRPFEQSLASGEYTFCEQDYGGAGPENRLFGRWMYAFSSSAFNDKKYTLACRAPPTASTTFGSAGNGTGLQLSTTTVVQNSVVTLAASPAAQGLGYSVHDVVRIDGGDALAVVQYVGSSGQVLQVALVFGGSGDSSHTYASAGTKTTTHVLAGAQRALRVVDGQAEGLNNATDAVSTAIVQNAVVSERINENARTLSSNMELNGGSDIMTFRSTQGSLGVSVGDFVNLGYAHDAILIGGTDKAANLTFTIATVSNGAVSTMSTFVDSGGTNTCRVGEYYCVLQGNAGTVLRCTGEDATNPTFEVARKGGGHFPNTGVGLYGPVPLNTTALVIDVVQPTYRRTAASQSTVSTQHLIRQSADPTFATWTQNSYHRDGSMVKLRLPARFEFNAARNLESFAPLDEPAFQILNSTPDAAKHYWRDDTVWPILGQPADSAVATSSLQLQKEWNIDRQNSIFVTLEHPRAVSNHTYVVQGQQCDNVLTKISYNTSLNKQYGALHSQKIAASRVDTIRIRLRDHRLRDAEIESFTVSFNIVETQ